MSTSSGADSQRKNSSERKPLPFEEVYKHLPSLVSATKAKMSYPRFVAFLYSHFGVEVPHHNGVLGPSSTRDALEISSYTASTSVSECAEVGAYNCTTFKEYLSVSLSTRYATRFDTLLISTTLLTRVLLMRNPTPPWDSWSPS
ncbi:hypothetical protein JYU34_010027 [Plutella xylostella]|uniref:Uncharacterized protein n=1 Tax=Plutella xylostella TaxID=51655 RepID=A0ABQ7QHJ3_PLUXY|nr:hypothetical protein JYU34_010027 [Plutella xylostella]